MKMKKYDYITSFVSDNFDELIKMAITHIVNAGVWNNPRGFTCKEIIAPQLVLRNPLNSLTALKSRKLNYAFATIEKFTYLSQVSKPDVITLYNKQMSKFINEETKDFDAPYGTRIKTNEQLEYCYQELKRDHDSRRAVIMIHQPIDCRVTKDSACTLSLQFLIRNGKLDMVATMRSNDIILGTFYDIPAFCFIQQVMAYWLGVEIGMYIHQPASLHYYSDFQPMVEELLSNDEVINERVALPEWRISHDDTPAALDEFWAGEQSIREHGRHDWSSHPTINQYLGQLRKYWERKK